jgi:hypothetical protein
MRRWRTVLATSLGAVSLGAVLVAGTPGWGTAPSAEAAAGDRAGRSVTLLTGDRVVLSPGGTPGRQIIPGPGRRDVRFLTFGSDGHEYVVPADAAPLIVSGKLDRRLFDITALVEAGYTDARRDDVPLIVTWRGRSGRSATLQQTGLRAGRELAAVSGSAVRVDKVDAARRWKQLANSSGVKRIWLDASSRVSLDQSVPQIGAPAAWRAGYTGKV